MYIEGAPTVLAHVGCSRYARLLETMRDAVPDADDQRLDVVLLVPEVTLAVERAGDGMQQVVSGSKSETRNMRRWQKSCRNTSDDVSVWNLPASTRERAP